MRTLPFRHPRSRARPAVACPRASAPGLFSAPARPARATTAAVPRVARVAAGRSPVGHGGRPERTTVRGAEIRPGAAGLSRGADLPAPPPWGRRARAVGFGPGAGGPPGSPRRVRPPATWRRPAPCSRGPEVLQSAGTNVSLWLKAPANHYISVAWQSVRMRTPCGHWPFASPHRPRRGASRASPPGRPASRAEVSP